MDPQKNAVFWIEHVIKHNGAHHLKPSNFQDKWYFGGAWYEYWFLDYICMFLVAYKLVKLYVRTVMRILFSSSRENKEKME